MNSKLRPYEIWLRYISKNRPLRPSLHFVWLHELRRKGTGMKLHNLRAMSCIVHS